MARCQVLPGTWSAFYRYLCVSFKQNSSERFCWCVSSSSRPLPSVFKLCPMCQKWPGGHIFYRGLYREKHEKNILIQNHKAWSLDIWYVSSPGRPLPILFKLCPWGQKLLRLRGHMFYTGLYRKNHEKIFFSETISHRALIFGM